MFSFSKKQSEKISTMIVRQPAAAGVFYPVSREALVGKVDGFLASAEDVPIKGRPMILIVPHAGYDYSGQVAAFAYKKVQGLDYRTVILIGSSHRAYFDGISVFAEGYFRTPLGDIEIDQELAEKIIGEITAPSPSLARRGERGGDYYQEAHLKEHSLEVQLPFLQKVLGDFKIVPILLGETAEEDCQILAKAIKKYSAKGTLIVASSDLSHYPDYQTAHYSDKKVIKAILSGEAEELDKTAREIMSEGRENLQTCLCGEGAVKTAMYLAKESGADEIRLLKYANSGDVTGERGQVVGYAAIIFSGKSEVLKH